MQYQPSFIGYKHHIQISKQSVNVYSSYRTETKVSTDDDNDDDDDDDDDNDDDDIAIT